MDDAADYLIRVNNVSKRFDEVVALSGVDFDIKPHEIHGLVGHNGSGKTTLLKIIAGIVKADEGNITVNSNIYNLKKWNVTQAKRHGIIYVSQEQVLYPNLDIVDNIYLINYHFFSKKSLLSSIDQREIMGIIDQYMNMFDVKIRLDTKIKELTPEIKELVQVIAALIVNVKVLLLDEPTSPLSAKEAEHFLAILRDISIKHGISSVFVSHRLTEVLNVSDRVTVLRNGRKIITTSTDGVTEQDVLRLMMGAAASEIPIKAPIETSDIIKPFRKIILSVKNLSTAPRVPTEVRLRNISFEVYDGEILGVTGLLGSGIYELGKALVGDAHIINGEIIFLGRKIKIRSPSHAKRLGILYIPEDRKLGLVYQQSIRLNVTLSTLSLSRIIINQHEEKKNVNSLIDRLKIKAPSVDALISQLSGGNQQKTLIARLFASKPRLVIINEPTVGIDLFTKLEIRKLILQLQEHGISALVISSELDDILSTAHRVLIMRDGTIKAVTRPNKDEILSYL